MQIAAFFDIDGTLTTTHVWQGFMDYFRIHNLHRGTHLLFQIVHYPLYVLRKTMILSESKFRTVWADHMAWYLREFTPDQAEVIWDWIVDQYLDRKKYWREDVCAILDEHLHSGHVVILVSSSSAPLIRSIALKLGTPHGVGTKLEISKGRYTGRSLYPVCIDQYKASMAKDYLTSINLDIDFGASFAYADSITDQGLLEMVGKPFAVYPDALLDSLAQSRGWRIFRGT
jgi:HAD superfamily hydrolase (TIGR01490 family)